MDRQDPTSGPRHSFQPVAGPQKAAAAASVSSAATRPVPAVTSRRRRLFWSLVRVLVATGLIGILAASAGLGLWLRELGVFSLGAEQIRLVTKAQPVDNSLIFDRRGDKIGELFSSYHVYVPYEELPPALVQAILAIEDRNFFEHSGFDGRGILRAGWVHLHGHGSNQGASTLTQQVVRNFLLPSERTLQRKVQEIAMAIALEKQMSKQEILTIYANSMFLGNGSYGVGAAAYRYFGKSVGELAPEESALIAGLFQSPSRYNPVRYPKRARQRQLQVLKAMQQTRALTRDEARELAQKKLVYREYHPLNSQTAPYFIDYVQEQAKKLLEGHTALSGHGLRIYTTLDPQLQKLAEASVANASAQLDTVAERAGTFHDKDGKTSKAHLEAAMLSVDPKTGEILAMVGGRSYAQTKFNRTTQALRSPGSAFKPVVYAQALAQHWKWSDVIFVSPITIQNYRPRTPDEDFGKETTLLRAFYRSMNTPTIELGEKVGLKPVIELAKHLGIRSPIKEEFGSMLGSSDVTMTDMARLYSSFANSGTLVEQTVISKIEDREGKVLYAALPAAQRSAQAVSPQIAFLMTEGMRAVLQMGTGAAAGHLAKVAAGKTGTANESTDNWFCGFAPNLATVVWVGTDEHTQIYGDVTGGKLALPIWDTYMTQAFKVRAPEPFNAPSGVVTAVVNPRYGSRAPDGVRMYFLKGNEPPAEASALEALSQRGAEGYRDLFNQ